MDAIEWLIVISHRVINSGTVRDRAVERERDGTLFRGGG